jgi:hypothetical protein
LGGAWHWTLSSWLPGWLPGQVQPVLAQELGTPVTWERLDIHPWTLEIKLHGLRVGEGAEPLFKLRSLTVQPSWEVIWRWAPVLRRVTLVGPEVNVARVGPGRFNFSPIVEHWQRRHPPQPDTGGEPARFAVFNIGIQEGAVRWRDEVLKQRHVVDQLQVGVPFVSNLPSFVDVEMEPALSARVDGSTLRVDGETLPFQQGRRSQVHLRWSDISVPQVFEAAQPFLPAAWRPEVPGGQLSADLTVRFEARTAPEVPRLGVTGQVAIDGLAMRWARLPVALPPMPGAPGAPGAAPGASATLGWQRLVFAGIDAQPLTQQAHLGTVGLEGLKVAVSPAASASGVAAPVGATPKPSAAAPDQPQAPGTPAAAPKPWAWSVGEVKLQADELTVQPWALPAGVKPLPRIEGLQALVKGLSADSRARPADWQLAWRDSAGGQLHGQGHVRVAQAEADAKLNWQGWSIADWSQVGGRLAGAPVRVDDGQFAGQLQLSWGKPGLTWQNGQMQVAKLWVSPASQAVGVKAPGPNRLAWAGLDVQGLQGAWPVAPAAAPSTPAPRPEVRVARVALQGLDAVVVREAGNRWFGLSLGEAAAGPSARSSAPAASVNAPANASAGALPPRFVLGAWSCAACKVQLDDRSVSPVTRLSLGPLQAQVSGLDTGQTTQPVNFELDTRALDSGRLQAQGQFHAQPLSLDARVRSSRIELKALQPYLDPYVNVVLQGAEPEFDGQLHWAAATAKRAQQVRYSGRLGVRDLHLQDRVNAADFLSWRWFGLDGAQVALDGTQVDARLGHIQLQDFYGRIIVNPDGHLNLASVMRSERGGATTSVTTPQAASAVASAVGAASAVGGPATTGEAGKAVAQADTPAAPAPKLSWRRVTLSGGRVDFTDHFIQPNYSARLTQVQGQVSAVSSQQSEPADLSISGAVDDAAPLRIQGKVQPLGPQLYSDIEASAKGIELSRLTPYAARYAGYGIDKGTLSVNVHYKIDQGKLDASNRVFLDQLTFGDASHSPDAIQLPIQFAVSLLKNARGEIDLNLPVSGSINDPKFSIGGIVWQVVVNLITKAVTAPFALLAGDGGEDWGHVPFAAGSADLNEAARRRLEGLAKSLADRPALKLEATGHAEVALDTLALRQQHLDRLMRAAKARATGQALAEVQVAAAEADTWLAAAYKAADLPTKPRNALGMAKTIPPAEMRSLLMAAAPVNEAALRELANARADQVKAFLAARIAPERVLLTASLVDQGSAQTAAGETAMPPARVQMVLR